MEKINWKQKLTSRKLWAAITAFLATVIVAVFKNEIPAEAADVISKGVIALCVYIFGESGIDIARMIWSGANGNSDKPPDNGGKDEGIH